MSRLGQFSSLYSVYHVFKSRIFNRFWAVLYLLGIYLFVSAQLNKVLEEDSKDAGKGKAKADVDSPTFKADKEIKELQEILPDIMSKVYNLEMFLQELLP